MMKNNHRINENGNLEINGADTTRLAEKYGTPLYLYDVDDICDRAQAFRQAFEEEGVGYQVAYASKAFSCVAIFELMDELGLSLDVVSGGELYTAVKAEFPPERIHFHGNNKTPDEIEMAVNAGIGCFVVDNFHELTWLMAITDSLERDMNVLLRITPGVEAHTHEYISTGQEDSKFGFDITSGQAEAAITQVMGHGRLNLLGVHCHIGSQIFDTTGFVSAVHEVFSHLDQWRASTGFVPEVVNLGGGFGIRYNDEDTPLPLGDYVKAMVSAVKHESSERNFSVPEIWIEPGRALVGEAGTTLYTVGARKSIPGIRDYISVDGGMTDNLRPALYQAKYEALVANKAGLEKSETVSVAGKCCESGDMLIWDLQVPELNQGDILAVTSTGAYGYSMASNYNRIARPPVVFIRGGEDACVVERETYENMTSLDRSMKQTKEPVQQVR
ncbi:diaminopimelate decarboxylase [Alteribacter natronophilus]|uniref:diaminopimelate decarboxylase n=1 Tax=Alteribacter natronophilus TaxID=2583810 RepID=UPI00110DC478|nr:diaminopimelate decarboxylase [Alteribacter natronophilus]TMW73669.1 diaminopimelate decarboxylase [Alteribacter natronophilus]